MNKRDRFHISVRPESRRDFWRALNYARRLGFNRSKFIVMAVIMLALDLGMEQENERTQGRRITQLPAGRSSGAGAGVARRQNS